MLALLLVAATATLPRGDTVFVDLEVPLARATALPIEAVIANQRSAKEIKLAPWVEASVLAPGKIAKLRYALRAAPNAAPGSYRLFAVLEIRERGGGPLGTAQIDQVVELIADAPTVALVDTYRKSYLSEQATAIEAYESLRSMHDLLRLDRVDPPPAKVAEKDVPALEKFLGARLRADVELRRLRTAADSKDAAIADAALLALGSLSKRPSGTVAKASAIEGETIGKALELTMAALSDLRIDEAEAFLDKLRLSGRLQKAELGKVLVLLGAVYAARSRMTDSEQSFGRALCIDPKISVAFDRPFFTKRLEAARAAANACKQPLAIGTVSALRVEGKTILIRATFAPDPHALIGGGDVEVWGSGGGVHRAEKVRASAGSLEASIEDTGDLQSYDGQLLLKVFVRDLTGVPIASFGDPDPAPVPIAQSSAGVDFEVPWWLWVGGAVVAVAGAATTVILLSTERDVRYGIGPISAQF